MSTGVRQPRPFVPREDPITGHDLDPATILGPPVPLPTNQLERFMDHMLRIDTSDLYLTAGSPPIFRTAGIALRARAEITTEQMDTIFEESLSDAQKAQFHLTGELNMVLTRGLGRYRVNLFKQRGTWGMVVRLVRTQIRSIDELLYPAILKEIATSRRGLVIVCGGSGQGKSTAVAALVDHRNGAEPGHIVTIEDPIEFVHPHKSCMVCQREVGTDTQSVEAALKNALRQRPDLVYVSELGDRATLQAALELAAGGHLVVSTLRANSVEHAVERMISYYPADKLDEIRSLLAMNLRAVVCTQLVQKVDGNVMAALEVMLDIPRVKELLRRGDVSALRDAVEQASAEGCRTRDGALLELFQAGRVKGEVALRAAERPEDLRMAMARWAESSKSKTALRLLPDGAIEVKR